MLKFSTWTPTLKFRFIIWFTFLSYFSLSKRVPHTLPRPHDPTLFHHPTLRSATLKSFYTYYSPACNLHFLRFLNTEIGLLFSKLSLLLCLVTSTITWR